jgi:hypothetical protein
MVSFAPFWSQPYSQLSQLQLVGTLQEKDSHGESISSMQNHQLLGVKNLTRSL